MAFIGQDQEHQNNTNSVAYETPINCRYKLKTIKLEQQTQARLQN